MAAKSQVPSPKVKTRIDLERHLPYRINYVSSLLYLSTSRLFQARFGFGLREWRVLAILGFYGPTSAADMVGPAASDKATVSRAIAVLDKRKLVKRLPDPGDARRQLVLLTEKGAEVHDQIAPLSRLRSRILEATLSEEERLSLQTILEKLRNQLEWLLAEEENELAQDLSDETSTGKPLQKPG